MYIYVYMYIYIYVYIYIYNTIIEYSFLFDFKEEYIPMIFF